MQLNKIMYIDLVDSLPKSYAPKKGEEMNRSTYSTMRYTEPCRGGFLSDQVFFASQPFRERSYIIKDHRNNYTMHPSL